MKLHGVFLGCAGVQMVHLPSVIAQHFGCSRSEARRLLVQDQVQLDGEIIRRVDLPVDEIAGRELTIGRETVEVGA